VFTSVVPAWNSANLHRLAAKISSSLVFAHVRAAYPGMPVSEENCHPFQAGRYMFMHNGGIAGFVQIRRKLLETLSDECYNRVESFHSDSAVCFAVFMHQLGCAKQPRTPNHLRLVMERTIETIVAVQVSTLPSLDHHSRT
jgi:glutamine amidotransferase